MPADPMQHDRLAVRLAIIISRLFMGETLSIDTLAGEFNVSTRTLRRDFNQRLLYLDLEYSAGTYRLGKSQLSYRTDKDIIHFAKLTHVANVFPALDSKLLSILLNKNVDSPYVVYHSPPKSQPTLFGGFYRITQAIIEHILIELSAQGIEYKAISPYRLVYFEGYWYLIGEYKLSIEVFLLIHITDVTLTHIEFSRKEYIFSMTSEPDFINALPHFQFVRKLLFDLKTA